MNTYQPYTYLIGWRSLNLWYYGVRFAKNCNPGDLWVSYFTSSKYVAALREQHGEPDVVQVRKLFSSAQAAMSWEERVLKRMNVIYDAKWINKAAGKAIDPVIAGAAAHRRMMNNNPMKNPETAKTVAIKMRQTNLLRYAAMTSDERAALFGNYGASNGFYGKRHPTGLQEQITRKISGNYTIHTPDGKVNNINNLYRYCKENNLNRDILLKYMDKGPVPPPVYRTNSVSRHNTTGYTIKRLS